MGRQIKHYLTIFIVCAPFLLGCSYAEPEVKESVSSNELIDEAEIRAEEPSELLDADVPVTVEETEPEKDQVELKDTYLIAIDAGHQKIGSSEKEPIGPGATEMKAKVTYGAKGCVTKLPEYELTLSVALKLKTELESRGYEVLMIREENDVNLSNSERAIMANDANADAFIRLHADSMDDSSIHGASTMCQSPKNPYNGDLAELSKLLSSEILTGLTDETGCKKRHVTEIDSMSGINWCQVPVSIVEMGFMSNPVDDENMADENYQQKIAVGIADGIDSYFSILENTEEGITDDN